MSECDNWRSKKAQKMKNSRRKMFYRRDQDQLTTNMYVPVRPIKTFLNLQLHTCNYLFEQNILILPILKNKHLNQNLWTDYTVHITVRKNYKPLKLNVL